MTDPIELCKRGTDEVIAYACGKCGSVVGSTLVHGDAAHAIAATHCDRTCHGAEKVEAVAVLRCANCGKVFARCAACNVHPRTVQSSMRAHMAVCHREYDKGRRKLPNKEWM